MPELGVVGQAADPQQLELDPVVIPVCAYAIETREEVIEKFPFKPTMPPGVLALIERLGGRLQLEAGVEGVINSALVCLQDCLMADARERWNEWIGRDDLAIEAQTIADVLQALMEYYAARPTRSRSGSSGTGPRAKRTSKAAQRSTA